MARTDYDEVIDKAREFVKCHPESGGLMEIIENMAAELAAAEDFIDSTNAGVRLGGSAVAVIPDIPVPS